MTSFKLAFLNLTRRRVSSLIALTAIAVAVACSGMLLRLHILSNARFSTMAEIGDAVVGAKAGGIEILLGSLNLEGPYPDFVPYNLYNSLKEQESVFFEDGVHSGPSYIRAVIPFLYFAKYKNYRAIGSDEDLVNRSDLNNTPRLKEGKWASGFGEAVLGFDVAFNEKLALNDKIVLTPWPKETNSEEGSKLDFRVVGIMSKNNNVWDRAVFSNVKQAQNILRAFNQGSSIWAENVLNYFLIYLNEGGLHQLQELINKRTVGQVISVTEQKDKLLELSGSGRKLGLLMTIMILLLGALSVAGMMVARFDAMTVQLAVLRALGYEKLHIAGWLVWEGLLLGIAACLIGASIDLLCFPWVRDLLGSTLPASEAVKSYFYYSAPVWAAAITATTLAVSIPIIRLYNQDIHFSLRSI